MIQAVGSIQPLNLISEVAEKPKTSDASFSDALNAAKSLLNATNESESVVNQLTYDFMTGKNENISNLMIAQEKSSILLSYTMQLRNQVLEAYREIMRIPV